MKADENYPTPHMRQLFTAILKLRNEKEAAAFFRDLLTIAELKEIANRWQAVKMLGQGKSYVEIAAKLGMSSTTVTRVAHWLKDGLGGYKTLANRIFHK
jgi:TrpR-related protein YerC/YecD